jgi:cytochrome c biogenesis protein CcmG/thiol:disulfide interchange protein DsbE
MAMPRTSRSTKALSSVAVAIMALTAGCDRGSHPEQLAKPAPDFTLNDGQHAVNLAQYRGKVVVLSFWASWCAPCIEEMPSLEQMQRNLPQIQVVAIASDEDLDQYQSFLAKHPVSLLTVFDSTQKSNALYGSFRFPETYIIDKKGIIRRKLVGPQDFSSPEILDYLKTLAS